MRIDSHHHFWNYSREQYPWIDEGMAILRRDFGVHDLEKELAASGLDGAVSVQARQTVEETRWLLEIAEHNNAVCGVVGWLPLAEENVEELVEQWANHSYLVGLRHVVQDEPDDAFILGRDFNRGVGLLKDTGLVYDILIFAKHLENTIQFVDQHPEQVFVLDHIAKPTIHESVFDKHWQAGIAELAKRPHVYCKFSGVVTEVRDETWTANTIRPYWEVAWNAFGSQRMMFGSDWPVCLLKSEYARWVETVRELTQKLSESEQSAFWGDNAARVYRIADQNP